MTGTPHTPIYTLQELAELLAEHDRRFPKHGNCSCEHGLITATRKLFACRERPVPVEVFQPRPYVSPDVLRGTVGAGGHGR